jgi:peptidoglycan hydrolase FlgJ
MALTPDMAAQAGLSQDLQQKIRLEELRKNLTPRDSEEKRLRGACEGFEAVFINKLLAQMRASVPKGGFLHSQYEDQYLSMFDQELAEKMAKDGGIGLGQMMFDQVSGKLHPRRGGNPAVADVNENHAVNRFPQAKTKGYQSDIVPKDGLRAHASSPKTAQDYAPSRLDAGQAGLTPAAPGMAMATPSQGEISSDFGWRDDPFTGKRAWHAGVDIKAPEGSKVAACWDGSVIFAGERGGLGKCVVVEHTGGWQSIYGHNSKIAVREGDKVAAGQKIAEIGDSGRSTGAHLHFELRRDGVPYNPVQVQLAALGETGKDPGKGGQSQVASR